MFVDTFIRRPILASVCSLVLILAGAVAIPTMPVAQYPSLAPPQVNVTAVYTGANAQEVETAVTTPLEQAINGAEGMLYMTSSSTNSGISTITVTFDITRDQDVAAVDVQNRVNQTLGRAVLLHQFRDHILADHQIGQNVGRHADQAPDAEGIEGRHAIGGHHWHAGNRKL